MTQLNKFYVRVVTTHKGGAYSNSLDLPFDTKNGAKAAAEKLQEEFDADAEPRRVYVLDDFMVPVEAAGRIKFKRRG